MADSAEFTTQIQNILLVEEDTEAAGSVKALLEEHGYEVTVAKDGGQAHASYSMSQPDFVILGLVLPGESGFELCEWIKLKEDKVPVMALTSVQLDESRKLAARVGFDGYVINPYNPDALLQMIRRVSEAYWDRGDQEQDMGEKGEIHFTCRCGNHLKIKYRNKGKGLICPKCNSPVTVPQVFEGSMLTLPAAVSDSENRDDLSSALKFVNVKCHECGTYYRLFSTSMQRVRKCPQCQTPQSGALSIKGVPMSRAALATTMRVLKIMSGKLRGKKLLLPDHEVTVGSDKSCHLRFIADRIRPRHCLLVPQADGLLMKKMGGALTLVNSEPVEVDALLQPGDTLQIGPVQLRVEGDSQGTRQDLGKKQAASGDTKNKYEQSLSTRQAAAAVIEQHWAAVRRRILDKHSPLPETPQAPTV